MRTGCARLLHTAWLVINMCDPTHWFKLVLVLHNGTSNHHPLSGTNRCSSRVTIMHELN